jgi:hypothetical protein
MQHHYQEDESYQQRHGATPDEARQALLARARELALHVPPAQHEAAWAGMLAACVPRLRWLELFACARDAPGFYELPPVQTTAADTIAMARVLLRTYTERCDRDVPAGLECALGAISQAAWFPPLTPADADTLPAAVQNTLVAQCDKHKAAVVRQTIDALHALVDRPLSAKQTRRAKQALLDQSPPWLRDALEHRSEPVLFKWAQFDGKVRSTWREPAASVSVPSQ